MTKKLSRTLVGSAGLLLALSLLAPAAPAQQLKDTVIIVSYLNIKPEMTNAWLKAFKQHFHPALKELQEEGALLGWHLFVPGIHHPGGNWTHAVVLGIKDRPSQARVEKRLQEALAGMPAPQAKMFYGAIDLSVHYDDEWREIDIESIPAPEEKAEEEGEGEAEEEKD